MLMGAHGVISVTANVAPALMAKMCAAALAGDFADGARLQRPAAAAAPQALRRSQSDPGQMGAGGDGTTSKTSCGCRWFRCRRSITRRSAPRCAKPAVSDERQGVTHASCFAFSPRTRGRPRRCAWPSRLPAANRCRLARQEDRLQVGRPARRRWRFRRTSPRRSTTIATTSRRRRGSPPATRRGRAPAATSRPMPTPMRGSCAPAPSAGWS